MAVRGKGLKHEKAAGPPSTSLKARVLASAPEPVLDRLQVIQRQLKAKDYSAQELLELAAAAILVTESLEQKLTAELGRNRMESGAAPILRALASSASPELNMLNTVEIALKELSPGNPTLSNLKVILASAHGDARSDFARKAASQRHAKSDKGRAREFVHSCWLEWRTSKTKSYRSAAAFARAMLDKFPDTLESQVTIARWVREWDKTLQSTAN